MKAYRVSVEPLECIVFEVSSFRARARAVKAFKKWYSCPPFPVTRCERTPYLDHLFDETVINGAWVESSLGEGMPTEAFGGGF